MTQVKQNAAVAKISGVIIFATATNLVRNRENQCLVISTEGHVIVMDEFGNSERHVLPYGAAMKVKPNQSVGKGETLATWCPHTTPIIAEVSGTVSHLEFEEGVTVAREVDEVTGLAVLVVIGKKKGKAKREANRNPRIVIDNKDRWSQATKVLPQGTMIFSKENLYVERGDILARMFNE